jgi:hypothetical protein
MVSPSHKNHLSREVALEGNFQIGSDFGMIASRKRLGRNTNPTGKKIERRTWPWSSRTRSTKERVPRETMRGQPHNQGRRTLVRSSALHATRMVVTHHSVRRRRGKGRCGQQH